jgi:hypothetical protein
MLPYPHNAWITFQQQIIAAWQISFRNNADAREMLYFC